GGRGRAVVLANGTEGEPASYKDKLLVCNQPHLVADGALLAAAAVGAGRVVIGVEETAGEALGALRRALAERERSEPAGIPVEVVATPPGYVTGEESALVAFVNGGPALPTTAPPRPLGRGRGAGGAARGAGVVIVVPEGAWGLSETARIMAWFVRQGAGQWGPCVFELAAIAGEMAALACGALGAGGLARLQRWGSQVEGRGGCRHPDGSVRLARSALRAFPLDVEAHLGGHPC